MEAAERFEPERGNRFSTYATYWIRQRILRSISEYSRIIRLPAHGMFDSLVA
jgi:RNA polymerase primary sigma factor